MQALIEARWCKDGCIIPESEFEGMLHKLELLRVGLGGVPVSKQLALLCEHEDISLIPEPI